MDVYGVWLICIQLLEMYLKSHHWLSYVTYVHAHLKCVDLLLCTRGSC
jgi:hypothetical protein